MRMPWLRRYEIPSIELDLCLKKTVEWSEFMKKSDGWFNVMLKPIKIIIVAANSYCGILWTVWTWYIWLGSEILFYTSKAWSHGKFQRSDYSENAQNSSSLQNGDVSFIKFLIDVFYNDYSKRIRQAPFVDAPLVFLPGWNIVKSWLTGTHSPNLIRLKYFTAFWWIIQVWFSRDLTYTTIQSIFSKVADWSAMTSSLFWLKTISFDFMKTENQ